MELNAAKNTINIDFNNFDVGIYIYKIQNTHQIITGKIVKID